MSTSTMQIMNVRQSPSGKSLIVDVAGRQEGYFAKLDSGLQSGMTIEAETKASEFKGKTSWWIEKWKAAQPQQPQTAPQIQPQPQGSFSPTGINLAFLPFVSNCVAHAIQAGRIQSHGEIREWANAAYEAAHNLKVDDFQ